MPLRLVEAPMIRRLMSAGALVIASGGGGVPVVDEPGGRLRGVEAVIDKDLAAVIVAREVRAESLLLLTDVTAVQRGWMTDAEQPIREMTAAEAEGLRASGAFGSGSMEPKVRACAQFVRAGGKWAAIGALEEAQMVFEGQTGTRIVPDPA
jgi:carbamate kinase